MTRVLRTSLPPSLAILAGCDLLVLFACFTLAAYWTQSSGVLLYLFYQDGLLQFGLTVILIQITLYLERVYERFVSLSFLFCQVCLALGIAFLFQALLAYVRASTQLPRWTMIFGSLLVLLLFPPWRLAAAGMLGRNMPLHKLLFLEATPPVGEISQRLQAQPEVGLRVVGYVGHEGQAAELPYLGSLQQLDSVIDRHGPDRLVIGRNTAGIPVPRLLDLQRSGTQVEKLSTLYEAVTGRICFVELPPSKLIFSRDFDPRPGYVTARNIYSVLIGLLLLLAASPLLAIAAVMTKRSSDGPVFDREPRVGLKGATINLYRFRNRDSPEWLRKFNLMNLPLLLNVVRGDLALVGPAPEHPEFLAPLRKWIPLYNHRLSVKPGLTGWAQIHQNPASTPNTLERLEYDLYYIKHLSPQLDAYIAILSLRPR